MKIGIYFGLGFRLLGDWCIDRKVFLNRVHEIKQRRNNEKVIARFSKEPIYYLIKINAVTFGLATAIRYALGHIKYALNHGWIPVVDMQSIKNPYLEDDEVGKKNAWEFYFEQPGHVGLEDIAGKDNIIYAEQMQLEICPTDSMEFYTNAFSTKYWRALYADQIRLSDAALEYVKNESYRLFGNHEEKILGCVCRGTDYVERRAYRHPIQPEVKEMLKSVRGGVEKYGYDKVFLATEDESILEKFRTEFGDKLLYVEQQRYQDGSIPLALRKDFANETSRYMEGMRYLAAIYLLAECDALIGGRCGMTTISYVISSGYQYEYFWNLGRYVVDDYCLPEEYLT